jgi:hypothetical protein
MGRRARELLFREYTWTSIAERTIRAYERAQQALRPATVA